MASCQRCERSRTRAPRPLRIAGYRAGRQRNVVERSVRPESGVWGQRRVRAGADRMLSRSSGHPCDASRVDRVAESLAGEWTLLDAGVRADTSALLSGCCIRTSPSAASRADGGLGTRHPMHCPARQAPTTSQRCVTSMRRRLPTASCSWYVSVHAGRSVGRSSLRTEHRGRMRIRWHQGMDAKRRARRVLRSVRSRSRSVGRRGCPPGAV